MQNLIVQERLIERIYWLIRLRWIAVIGIVCAVLFTEKIINIPLAYLPLYSIATFLGLYNLVFLLYVKQIGKKDTANLPIIANRIANTQISLDLLSLTTLIHFSGGIENPFIFYFVFHMIIASILLSRRSSFLQATFAAVLLCAMATGEYLGLLHHYCLIGFATLSLHSNLLYLFGIPFAFITTLYIAVYMATSIAKRLREREKSLREANELLGEKDRIKSEYVLRVSHDIKEHLSAIESCLDPVAEGITGELNPRQKDLIQRAQQRTDKLLFFVKALLEITRIKLSKQIEMNNFSLKKTVENALNFVDARAKAKEISVTCNIDPAVDKICGAQIYIEETVANILANSVKYTPLKGKVNISVKDKGDNVLIQISDTGIGIPKEEIPKLFDEFYRASNAREIEREGTGLGLSIAKQVVERHKGRIWAESELGKGSTFYILLPKLIEGG